MRVEHLTNARGNAVRNQFILRAEDGLYLQSYKTIVVHKHNNGDVFLDPNWDCSRTTMKYVTQFLGEPAALVRKKLRAGDYFEKDLNP